MLREVENGAKVVVSGYVHGLGEAYIRSDGTAEEIERPEGGNDTTVKLPIRHNV